MRAQIVIAITFPLWLGLAATIVTGEANPIRSFTDYTNGVNSVVFLPDGLTLASSSRNGTIGTILLWNFAAVLNPNKPPNVQFTTYILGPPSECWVVRTQSWCGDYAWFNIVESADPGGIL